MGAIGEDGAVVWNEELVDRLGVSERQRTRAIIERGRDELAAAARTFRGGRPPLPVAGATVVVVDDGIATGATARAAAAVLRARGAARLVLAAPVGPPDFDGAPEFDVTIIDDRPAGFVAVGQHYVDFAEVPDATVVELLERGPSRREGDVLRRHRAAAGGPDAAGPGARASTRCSCACTPARCAAPTCTSSTATCPIRARRGPRPRDRRRRRAGRRRRPRAARRRARRRPVARVDLRHLPVLHVRPGEPVRRGAVHRLPDRRRLRRALRRRRAVLLPAPRPLRRRARRAAAVRRPDRLAGAGRRRRRPIDRHLRLRRGGAHRRPGRRRSSAATSSPSPGPATPTARHSPARSAAGGPAAPTRRRRTCSTRRSSSPPSVRSCRRHCGPSRRGGTVVCAGIHMSDIPAFPYADLWGERRICSVANLTRADGVELLGLGRRGWTSAPRRPRSPCRRPTRRWTRCVTAGCAAPPCSSPTSASCRRLAGMAARPHPGTVADNAGQPRRQVRRPVVAVLRSHPTPAARRPPVRLRRRARADRPADRRPVADRPPGRTRRRRRRRRRSTSSGLCRALRSARGRPDRRGVHRTARRPARSSRRSTPARTTSSSAPRRAVVEARVRVALRTQPAAAPLPEVLEVGDVVVDLRGPRGAHRRLRRALPTGAVRAARRAGPQPGHGDRRRGPVAHGLGRGAGRRPPPPVAHRRSACCAASSASGRRGRGSRRCRGSATGSSPPPDPHPSVSRSRRRPPPGGSRRAAR